MKTGSCPLSTKSEDRSPARRESVQDHDTPPLRGVDDLDALRQAQLGAADVFAQSARHAAAFESSALAEIMAAGAAQAELGRSLAVGAMAGVADAARQALGDFQRLRPALVEQETA